MKTRLIVGVAVLAFGLALGCQCMKGMHGEAKEEVKEAPAAAIVAPAANATGTWQWTMETRRGQRESSVRLQQEGGNLTGGMIGRQGSETPIEEGTVTGDEIAFKVTRERQGQKFVTTYKGKVSGDTITGTITQTGRSGRSREIPWEAKRQQ